MTAFAPQFSIARFPQYMGCTFQGKHYTYCPTTDELIRDDVLKEVTKLRKADPGLKPENRELDL